METSFIPVAKCLAPGSHQAMLGRETGGRMKGGGQSSASIPGPGVGHPPPHRPRPRLRLQQRHLGGLGGGPDAQHTLGGGGGWASEEQKGGSPAPH